MRHRGREKEIQRHRDMVIGDREADRQTGRYAEIQRDCETNRKRHKDHHGKEFEGILSNRSRTNRAKKKMDEIERKNKIR